MQREDSHFEIGVAGVSVSRLAQFRSAVEIRELRELDIRVCRKAGNTSSKGEEMKVSVSALLVYARRLPR